MVTRERLAYIGLELGREGDDRRVVQDARVNSDKARDGNCHRKSPTPQGVEAETVARELQKAKTGEGAHKEVVLFRHASRRTPAALYRSILMA